MNPVKAGLCQKAEEYPHSSAREYLLGVKGITDIEWIGEIMEEGDLRDFLNMKNDDRCLDMTEAPRKGCTDEVATKRILHELGSLSPCK